MNHSVDYHRYDIFLPTAIEKIRFAVRDTGNGPTVTLRDNQLSNLDHLLTAFLEEQGLGQDLTNLPGCVVPGTNDQFKKIGCVIPIPCDDTSAPG